MLGQAISGLTLAAALTGCGPARLDGPLTQTQLDDIQSACGISGAKLVSAEAHAKVQIRIELPEGAGDGDIVAMLLKGKCLEDRLTALGVDHHVGLNLNASRDSLEMQDEFARDMKSGIDQAIR